MFVLTSVIFTVVSVLSVCYGDGLSVDRVGSPGLFPFCPCCSLLLLFILEPCRALSACVLGVLFTGLLTRYSYVFP